MPYKLYTVNNTIVVLLSTNHTIPYFDDCVASAAAGVGVDLTDSNQWDVWNDACLCWNVLEQRHEFHSPENLIEITEFYIPFDHATGQLRSVLSLLKFAQSLHKPIFSSELPLENK